MTRVEPQVPGVPARRFHVPVPRFTIRRFLFLLILVAAGWLCGRVAQTGLVRIPVFTRLFYSAPVPREARVATDSGNVQEKLRELAGGGVTITNAELSDLARAGAERLGLGLANVAVVGQLGAPLEFSCSLPQRNNALLRLELVPEVRDGELTFQATRTRLGMLDVPSWLLGEPTRLLVSTQLFPLLEPAPPVATAQVTDRGLHLTFTTP